MQASRHRRPTADLGLGDHRVTLQAPHRSAPGRPPPGSLTTGDEIGADGEWQEADDCEPGLAGAGEIQAGRIRSHAHAAGQQERQGQGWSQGPAMTPAPDEARLAAWIQAIAQGDEQALAALYRATGSRVYGSAMHVARCAALAEEVVETTYLQAWREAARFDPARGRALTWLLCMARSRARDAMRREARFRCERLASMDTGLGDSAAQASDELLGVARGRAALHLAIQALQPQPRQLVALAFFRGLSHDEIACHTGLPLGTVKSQLRRSLSMLRHTLAPGSGAALTS